MTLPPVHGKLRPSARPAPWLLGLVLVALLGCDIPTYQGPQIQEPPNGFFLRPEAVLDREIFPEKEIVYRDAWVNTSWGEVSTIHITGHPGATMRFEVQEAREAALADATEPVTFSDLSELTIDGRTAWGWDERLQTAALGIDWVAYRVVIPYDTITYSVELYSGDPTFKGVPDTLAAIASTFAVGKTTWNIPLILAAVALAVFLITTAQKRARARTIQMQSINFVKVERKTEEEEAKKGEAAAKTEKAEEGGPPPEGAGSKDPDGVPPGE